MRGEIQDFDDRFNIFDSQSVCSTNKSRDLLVKFIYVNIISHNFSKRNINYQLKTISEEKHKEYLHNAGCKSPSLESNKNNENSQQCNNFQDRNVGKNQPK